MPVPGNGRDQAVPGRVNLGQKTLAEPVFRHISLSLGNRGDDLPVNRWFVAWILVPLAGVPAHSAPLSQGSIVVPEPKPERRSVLKFRIIEDAVFAATPLHNSGMIAQTPVTPNATIGIGLLRVSPRRAGSGEFRQETGAQGSRKAAVRFVLKF